MTDSTERELLQVTLELWHPDCWGIISTDEVGSGLVGHGVAVDGRSAYERCTIHGDSPDHVEQAIAVARESQFINTIERLGTSRSVPSTAVRIGQSTQDVFIEYDATEGMGAAFFEQGFVLDSTYRIVQGIETWELLAFAPRSRLQRSLDAIQRDRDADITITRLSPVEPTQETTSEPSKQRLTARQREAIDVARRRGYYQWPRAVSATELARDLGVSKATFLEHLRKAEATLLAGE